MVKAVPFDNAITQFKIYLSQSVNIAKNKTHKQVRTVLIGHNASTFDTPILLRNAGKELIPVLQSMDVWFAALFHCSKISLKANYLL